MSSTTVADGVVDRLVDWGVERVFGYAGDGVDPILAALRRQESRIELVTARHEEMAAFMATGHAKYGGGVGVCLATQGPGAIHLLGGLYDAKLDRRPVVAIVGQVVTTALGSGYQQEVDLHTLFKDVCAQYLQVVASPQALPHVLDDAFRTALATSSPVCVIVPHDIQQAEAPDEDEQGHGIVRSSTAYAHPRTVPDDAQLRAAAELLGAGRRVAVLAGQGAAGAERQVRDVVERLGAGLTTSLLGKPLLDESLPYHCGVMGHLGTTASADLMAGCDTLLIVGSNDPWTEYYPAPGQARAVQIDVTARNIGTKFPVEAALPGDAASTLDALLPLLPERDGWRQDVEGFVTAWHDVAERRVTQDTAGLNPQLVVHELSAQLPPDVQVAVDVGSATYWYARFLRLPAGSPAHLSSTLASMGSAMPYGIAAKLLHPDRPVVALAGRRRHADERSVRAHHRRAPLARLGRPALRRPRAQQRRPRGGQLGTARDGGRPPVPDLPDRARVPVRRLRATPRARRRTRREARPGPRRVDHGARGRPARGRRGRRRPRHPAPPAPPAGREGGAHPAGDRARAGRRLGGRPAARAARRRAVRPAAGRAVRPAAGCAAHARYAVRP